MPPKLFVRDVTELVQLLQQQGVKTMGRLDPGRFIWPVTRSECLELLAFFTAECLPRFGTYEDAMHPTEWSLFHARLSFALNSKLISPREVDLLHLTGDIFKADSGHKRQSDDDQTTARRTVSVR